MNDLIAAAAVIQGAQIQANYALWASVIGSLGVVLSIFIAAKFTLEAHKADKLADLKSKTYFECIGIFAEFSKMSIDYLYFNKITNEEILSKQMEFVHSLNKASFVSDDNINLKVSRFMIKFGKIFFEFVRLNDLSRKSDNELTIILNDSEIENIHENLDKFRENLKLESRNKFNEIIEFFSDLQNSLREELGIKVSNVINLMIKTETMAASKENSDLIKETLLERKNEF